MSKPRDCDLDRSKWILIYGAVVTYIWCKECGSLLFGGNDRKKWRRPRSEKRLLYPGERRAASAQAGEKGEGK